MSIPPERKAKGTFAIVDNRIARARKNLGDGAVVAFAYLSSRTGLECHTGGEFATIPKGGLGLALGTTERSAKRYIAELREAGHIVVARSEGRSWHYRLESKLGRTATLARASFTIVEFVDAEWSMAARRCWIGILSYLNRKNRLAVVGIDKLAIAIGKSRRQTRRLIRELEKAGFLTVTRGKRSCSVYAPIIARSARQLCPPKHDSHDPLKHDSHDPLSVTDSNSFQEAKHACETVGCGKRDFGALIDGLLSANAKKRKMALKGMGAETKTERILPPQLKLRAFTKEMKAHEQCHDNLAKFRSKKGYLQAPQNHPGRTKKVS